MCIIKWSTFFLEFSQKKLNSCIQFAYKTNTVKRNAQFNVAKQHWNIDEHSVMLQHVVLCLLPYLCVYPSDISPHALMPRLSSSRFKRTTTKNLSIVGWKTESVCAFLHIQRCYLYTYWRNQTACRFALYLKNIFFFSPSLHTI